MGRENRSAPISLCHRRVRRVRGNVSVARVCPGTAIVLGESVHPRCGVRRPGAGWLRALDAAGAGSARRRRRRRDQPDRVRVRWRVATDDRMRHGVRQGVAVADADLAHSVHVEVRDLSRAGHIGISFRCVERRVRPGRRAPRGRAGIRRAASASPSRRASCSSRGTSPPMATWRTRISTRRAHRRLHLRGRPNAHGAAPARRRRAVTSPATATATRSTDRPASAGRARGVPWFVVWDDHEVENNWASQSPRRSAPGDSSRRAPRIRGTGSTCRCAHRPIPNGPDMRLFRRIGFGDLVRSRCSTRASTAATRRAATAPMSAARLGRSGAHPHRRRPGAVAVRWARPVRGALERDRPAGLHGPARLRVGKAPGSAWTGGTAIRRPRPLLGHVAERGVPNGSSCSPGTCTALGGRPEGELRRSGVGSDRLGVRDDLD